VETQDETKTTKKRREWKKYGKHNRKLVPFHMKKLSL